MKLVTHRRINITSSVLCKASRIDNFLKIKIVSWSSGVRREKGMANCSVQFKMTVSLGDQW